MYSARFWRLAGFSLAELLVVLTIIGILLALLLVNFQAAREESRNTAVQTSLKEAQLALETYKAQNGHYPQLSPGGCTSGSGGTLSRSSTVCGPSFLPDLAPDFIPAVPLHTLSNNSNCQFIYTVDSSDGNSYKLTAAQCAEGIEDVAEGIDQDNELARCPSSCAASGNCNPDDLAFYTSYAVYSNGGQCF